MRHLFSNTRLGWVLLLISRLRKCFQSALLRAVLAVRGVDAGPSRAALGAAGRWHSAPGDAAARGDAASRNGSDVSHRGQFQEGEEKARVFFLGSSLCEVFVDGERGGEGKQQNPHLISREGGKI